MATIPIHSSKVKYNASTKTFAVGGKGIPFGTKHTLYNELTTLDKQFDFSHSTGSEWDVTTKWIYKSLDGYTFEVGNEDVTQKHAENYLRAKLRN